MRSKFIKVSGQSVVYASWYNFMQADYSYEADSIIYCKKVEN